MGINTADQKRSSVAFCDSKTVNMMWLPLTFLVLAGIVSAEHHHGWKIGNEYTYLVRSRTIAALDRISDEHTGILLKGLLTVQVKSVDTLVARLTNGQYARIQTELPNGWDVELSDQMLELRDLPVSGKPFEINIKHGVIRDLIVENEIPTWELNMLKSIVSQLQVDTQGENAIRSSNLQVPDDLDPYGMFKAMEDSVGGKCEVLYDFTPLSELIWQDMPELVPLPHLKGDGLHIDITKTKNYTRCSQRMSYQFGITQRNKFEPGINDNGMFLTKSSTSRIIISGTLKKFAIQSSVTTSEMYISPRLYDDQNGMVVSKMNLTLADLKKISTPLSELKNPESTGNLVYTYDNSFVDSNDRRNTKPTESLSTEELRLWDSTSSSSSNEEVLRNRLTRHDSRGSISSSEENTYLLPKPSLEDAPLNPLLPNFVGYKGKAIGLSGELDLLKTAKELVFEIAKELDDPSNIPNQETLDKFTILTDIIRTMNWQQLVELQTNMQLSPNELNWNDRSQTVRQNAWSVLKDVVTQAGTGPALLLIKRWFEKSIVSGWEAVDIISRIAKTARLPTPEYIRTVFELVTSPTVKNEKILSSTAILAFTELVRYSQVDRTSMHNRYPVHTFGRINTKHDLSIVQEYIPYLERELKDAMKNRDSPKVQTYILALGSIAHRKILSVLEPYLEGKLPTTIFQRTLMVASLSKLVEINPKLARSVLYKIYLNTMESHEVRCIAVYMLMKTNPPLYMLQRMAKFTNYDTSKHVNSAVQSIIVSLAELDSPMYKELANKAKIAKDLLSTEDYDYMYSHGFMSDIISDGGNVIEQDMWNYIGSDDTSFPRSIYYRSETSYGDFNVPQTEFAVMVSSVRHILNILTDMWKQQKVAGKWATENIASELGIVPDEQSQVEGNILWDDKFSTGLLPFDSDDIRRIPKLVAEEITRMKKGGFTNWSKLKSYDVVVSLPTETGLPFVYTLKVPILYKINGLGKLDVTDDAKHSLVSDVRLVYSRKIQGRIGFITPFEHQHYISGVDVNLQAYAPFKISLETSNPLKGIQWKLWPLKDEVKPKLLHFSVIPYTAVHNILKLRPLLTERTARVLRPAGIQNVKRTIPTNPTSPIALEIDLDTVSTSQIESQALDTLQNIFMTPKNLVGDTYLNIDVHYVLNHELKKPLCLNLAYDWLNAKPNVAESKNWMPTAKAVIPTSEKTTSDTRKKLFLQEAVKGINAGRASVADIQLEVEGELNGIATLAWAVSNINNRARLLSFWRFEMPEHEIKYQVSTATQAETTISDPVLIEQSEQIEPKLNFDTDIRYGETCTEEIRITGKVSQTKEARDELERDRHRKLCGEQMKLGNKMLQTCRKAANIITFMNKLDLSIDVPKEYQQVFIDEMWEAAIKNDLIAPKVSTLNPKNAGKKKIDINLEFNKDFEFANISVYTWSKDMHFDDLNLLDESTAVGSMLAGTENTDVMGEMDMDDEGVCVLDKTRIETFDGKEYPLRLGKCWHVAMTTFPTLNINDPNNKLSIVEDESVSIMARELENGQKEVKIVLGDNEIKLLPTADTPEVLVNGERIQISNDKSYQLRQGNDAVLDIYKTWVSTIGVISDVYDVNLVFDGKRLMIQASNKFRNSVRGLCGNFDGVKTNDFLGPKNCMLKRPDEFTATYALIKDQCEGLALETAKRISEFECTPRENRLNNVINDVEAGRARKGSDGWGYHKSQTLGEKRCTLYRTKVIEEGDKLCFTTRPVISCNSGCTATETKTKNYQFHCMKKSQAATDLKTRVEKGANPDLSQKLVSLSRQLNVPLACTA